MIDRLVDAGAPVDRCCRILGVSRQSYYKHKRTPSTPRQLRREFINKGNSVSVQGHPDVQVGVVDVTPPYLRTYADGLEQQPPELATVLMAVVAEPAAAQTRTAPFAAADAGPSRRDNARRPSKCEGRIAAV